MTMSTVIQRTIVNIKILKIKMVGISWNLFIFKRLVLQGFIIIRVFMKAFIGDSAIIVI